MVTEQQTKLTCKTCGQQFTETVAILGGKPFCAPAECPDCQEATQRLQQHTAQQEALTLKEEQWEAICPPLYRDTDPAKVSQKFWRSANEWTPDKNGLGFVGKAGTGKTRCAFALLRKQHMAGKSVMAISITKYSKLVQDQFSSEPVRRNKAEEALEKACRCAVLLLDDVGKAKFTDRAEMEIYDLLETRTSHKRPTIWTSNSGKEGLTEMMSPDRAEPIIRRLAEFSTIITEL